MKNFVISVIAVLFLSLTCQGSIDSFIVNRYRQIVKLIETGNAKELSKLIAYPVKRENPLPDITSAAEFVSYYKILFDKVFKDQLKQYNDNIIFQHNGDYGLVGGGLNGEIWINEKGKIIAINYSSAEEQQLKQALKAKIKKEMHPDVKDWKENRLVARSEKLLIRIDETEKGVRYSCWSKGKKMIDQPDIVLYNGIEEMHGSQGGWSWTFKSGDWTYVVDNVQICGDTEECGLFLRLLLKGQDHSVIKLREIK
ncbi:hypothetical protein A3860_16450 [Niastella vici]|uniref:Uncharacterized protein n=1 Tax=Niastella vici TaxID=1703345 RepID=A0A1V9G3W0_9BACT|nr:hypothetical protein [Niastella vici]OQP65260.1 hypothetical protein A3860_16450 [Niastella vici]